MIGTLTNLTSSKIYNLFDNLIIINVVIYLSLNSSRFMSEF